MNFMKLQEHQSKKILHDYGIAIPKGLVVTGKAFKAHALNELTFPVAIKAQIPIGNRYGAGGIRFASTVPEAIVVIEELTGAEIQGFEVKSILVEEKLPVLDELYLSIFIDRDVSSPLLMSSSYGGVGIENTQVENVMTIRINPLIGLQKFMVRKLLAKFETDLSSQIETVVYKMYNLFKDFDALLVEVNPLAITAQGEVVALDAKVIVDDNALFRHKNLQSFDRGFTPFEQRISEIGATGIEVDGDIAVITSGAGCLMATIDTVRSYGGTLRAAIDLGGAVLQDERLFNTISNCLSSLKEVKPKTILFNAYLQIASCDLLAQAIRRSLDKSYRIPMVVRLKGKSDDVAEKILRRLPNLFFTKSFDKACKEAVLISKRGICNDHINR